MASGRERPSVTEVEREYARRVDTMKKIVVSRSGNIAEWGNSKRVANLDAQAVLDLKGHASKAVVVSGSLSVVKELVRLGLVDTYHLLIHPTFLCRGKALFAKQQGPLNLEFVSAHPFRSGVVLAKYRSTRTKHDSTNGEPQ